MKEICADFGVVISTVVGVINSSLRSLPLWDTDRSWHTLKYKELLKIK